MLVYLENVLYRINYIKKIFRKCKKNWHFNFPKWHIIIHYPIFICKYKVVLSYLININEVCYIDNIKKLFNYINKYAKFERQLFKYNIYYLNASTAYNIKLFNVRFRHKHIKYILRFYVNIMLKRVLLNYK